LLSKSASAVYAFSPMGLSDRKSELFYNFKISIRGAIRQAPNVVTWCVALKTVSRIISGEVSVKFPIFRVMLNVKLL
jgi:hypothetical protein